MKKRIINALKIENNIIVLLLYKVIAECYIEHHFERLCCYQH